MVGVFGVGFESGGALGVGWVIAELCESGAAVETALEVVDGAEVVAVGVGEGFCGFSSEGRVESGFLHIAIFADAAEGVDECVDDQLFS